ncbi:MULTISPECIES: M56 family metallopeptidase [unclassified Saccharopolyspora]|uniref:M56 family metallopeptidase n=1 Tax=Saccharopolyspora TaxID=1835 RepID=UPI00190D5B8C|nr:M56 family metallopeptidase [Saccharopolyspora sp. HNM0986]MBK0868811.1 M56 family metallopeptidase [Saccharopolyspora sp. HNM0986]
MITSLLLVAYAAVLAVLVAPALRRALWTERVPSWGVAAWLSVSWSLVLAVAIAVVSLCLHVPGSFEELYRALALCRSALTGAAGFPAAVLVGFSLAGTLLGFVRLAYVLGRQWWGVFRTRCEHAHALRLLGATERGHGIVVLNDDRPVAYCVPGRNGRIVFTEGALARLSPSQYQAVLAHERAHLRGRHAVLVALGAVPARLLPRLPAARQAADAVGRLVEFLADDAASRRTDPLTLAEALLELGAPASTSPARTLSAAGTATSARVTRLLHVAPNAHRAGNGVPLLVAIGGVVMPFVLAAISTEFGSGYACLFQAAMC